MKKSMNALSSEELLVVSRANKRLGKIFFGLMLFGVILPFLLPESSSLVDTNMIRFLGTAIPSSLKLAVNARFPNVVQAYIVIMLTLSFWGGLIGFIFVFFRVRLEYLQSDIARDLSLGIWAVWLRRLGGIFLCAVLIYLLYILPGVSFSGDPRGSRGQLILSFMVMTKPGLAIFGGFIAGGVAAIWFALLHALYSLFKLPFLAFKP